eukprot:10842687-Alexandrium_andersonii.AAC.1
MGRAGAEAPLVPHLCAATLCAAAAASCAPSGGRRGWRNPQGKLRPAGGSATGTPARHPVLRALASARARGWGGGLGAGARRAKAAIGTGHRAGIAGSALAAEAPKGLGAKALELRLPGGVLTSPGWSSRPARAFPGAPACAIPCAL